VPTGGGWQACRHRRGGLPGYGGRVSIARRAGTATCARMATARSGPVPGATSFSPAVRAASWLGSPQPTGAAAHRPTVPGGRLRGRPHAGGNAARIPRRPMGAPRRQASKTNDQRVFADAPSPGDQSHPCIADAPQSECRLGPVCDSHRHPVRPDAARCHVPAPGRQPGSIEPAGKLDILVKPAQVIVAACG